MEYIFRDVENLLGKKERKKNPNAIENWIASIGKLYEFVTLVHLYQLSVNSRRVGRG